MAGQVVGASEPDLAAVLADSERRVLLRGGEPDRRAGQHVQAGQAVIDRRDQPLARREGGVVFSRGYRCSITKQFPRAGRVAACVGGPVDLAGLAGHDDGQHLLPLRRIVDPRGADLAHRPAGLGQAVHRAADRGPHLVGNRGVGQLPGQHPDRERPGRGGRRGRREVGDDPQEVGGALDGGGQGAGVVAAGGQREHAVHRDQPVAGLEADDAAVGGRDADRAAGVRADRQVADARGNQGGGPARRAARGAGRVARVAGVPDLRVGEAGRVLQALGGGEDLGAGCPEPGDQGGVPLGRRRVAGRAAAGGGHPGYGDDVLDRHGPPGQRSGPRPGPLGGGQGADHGVQRSAEALQALVGGQQIQVGPGTGAVAALDGRDELGDPGNQRPAGQRAQDGGRLGRPVPDGQVAVDAGVGLGRGPVEVGQPGQRPLEVGRVEAVEAHRPDRCPGQHLAGHGQQQLAVGRIVEDGVDGQVADGGGEQLRPVGLLGPQVAEHLGGGLGVGDVLGQRADPVGQCAVQLADHERAPIAAQHDPGLDDVRAEVHERLDDPARADGIGDDLGIQPVLEREHVARARLAAQPSGEQGGRRGGVVGLDREQDRPVDLVRQVGGQHCGHGHGELLDRPGDPQAGRVHRGDDGGIGVGHEHVMAVTDETCGDDAADGTAAQHEVAHGAQRYNTVNLVVQVSALYLQIVSLPPD